MLWILFFVGPAALVIWWVVSDYRREPVTAGYKKRHVDRSSDARQRNENHPLLP